MATPRFGRIYQRRKGGKWWIAYYHHGKEVRESAQSYKQGDAERLLKTRHAEIIAGKYHTTPNVTVDQLLDDLLHDYQVNEKSSQWVKLVNDTHLRPHFGHLRADQVTTSSINSYIAKRRRPRPNKATKKERPGAKNATINRELSLLRRAFNLALRSDPPKVAGTPRFPKLAEHNVRKGFFEHHEYLALRNALPEHVKPILTFAYYTGTRRGELLNLKWNQVDLERHLVRLEPGETKNNDARLIPLTSDLTTTLRDLKTKHDTDHPTSPWVFTYHGQKMTSIKTAWTNACTTAGLLNEHGKPTKLFHDLRRTGVRNLVRAGVPELIAMKISGHRTRSVFDRYNITTENDLHDAAARLQAFHQRT